ncbi:hypothetical protein ACNQFZ_18365 [Schinkia sp. CFF1]
MDAKREIIKLALLLDEILELYVFVDYSSHVKQISVRVFDVKEGYDANESPWSEYNIELLNERFYFDFPSDESVKKFEDIKVFLQNEIDKRIAV